MFVVLTHFKHLNTRIKYISHTLTLRYEPILTKRIADSLTERTKWTTESKSDHLILGVFKFLDLH